MFIIFSYVLIVGINLATQYIKPVFWQNAGPWLTMGEPDLSTDIIRMRVYSLVAFIMVPLLGLLNGYFVAGIMLKPLSQISSAATRISSTNLKERINYRGYEGEIKRLADTFDDMLERLDKAFETQKQFVQDASHELRTPIAIAQTKIEVAEMNEETTIDDYKRVLQVIKENLDRMTQLSNQLLLLTADTKEPMNWRPTDIKTIINEVADEISTKLTMSGINLEIENMAEGIKVKGDALLLKHAVYNLIDNAIKYNRPGGWIRISAVADKTEIILQVQDNGIGISAADQLRIFDRFFRVDKSRSRSQGGNGLGLAIVKHIVEKHGGKITVESTPDKGSTFQMTLPRYLSI
jgi:signal transduction histidine kinase